MHQCSGFSRTVFIRWPKLSQCPNLKDQATEIVLKTLTVKTTSSLSRDKLKQLIEKRIGKENFVEKLGFITKHELYSRAAQKPQPVFLSPEQMLFDHEFTKLVKELEGQSETDPPHHLIVLLSGQLQNEMLVPFIISPATLNRCDH